MLSLVFQLRFSIESRLIQWSLLLSRQMGRILLWQTGMCFISSILSYSSQFFLLVSTVVNKGGISSLGHGCTGTRYWNGIMKFCLFSVVKNFLLVFTDNISFSCLFLIQKYHCWYYHIILRFVYRNFCFIILMFNIKASA